MASGPNYLILFAVVLVIAAGVYFYEQNYFQSASAGNDAADITGSDEPESQQGESAGDAGKYSYPCYVGGREVECPDDYEPQEEVFEEEEYVPKPYKYVTEMPEGWLSSGQEADIVLYATGFDESGGALALNHPGKIATDGKRLAVSDTWNNRVLIWNEIPEESSQKPDIVLGQPDFESNTARLGAGGMNWPMGIFIHEDKLLVADAFNDRVLVWNEFPARNGQPADMVLGTASFDRWQLYADWEEGRDPKTRLDWPWDVWTNGEKLVVTSTVDGSVLIWNSFPARNNQPADLLLGYESFEKRFAEHSSNPLVDLKTPRAIASDGRRLVIGSYEAGGAYVWNEFPTKDGEAADFLLQAEKPDGFPADIMGLAMNNGRLIAAGDFQIYIWDDFPSHAGEKPNAIIGREKPALGAGSVAGPFGIATDGKRLFIADTNNNRVLVFNEIPSVSGSKADIVIGQEDFESDRIKARNAFTNPFPHCSGQKLIIGSDLDNKIGIYNRIPDESKAEPDVVISRFGAAGIGGVQQIATAGNKMIAANREAGRVLIWNSIPPKDNQRPDVVLGVTTDLSQWRNGFGPSGLNNPMGVATDGKKLFVADSNNNRIMVWNEIPEKNLTPADYVLGQPDFYSTGEGNALNQLSMPVQLSTDGKRLVVGDNGNKRVLVWKDIPEKSGVPADFEIKIINHAKNMGDSDASIARLSPGGVWMHDEKLFVVDASNNRVLVWSAFPENGEDEPDTVIGQPDFSSRYPSNSRSSFAVFPQGVCFDGSFLWVGEMKWSNRLLRFSVK